MPSTAGPPDSRDSANLRPLHGGRHSIAPDYVAHSQRERLLSGLAAAVAEHGYNAATITQVTELASVSRRTFYENFESKEACFLATYEALDDYIASELAAAIARHEHWPQQVAGSLTALISLLAERPDFARVYLVEAPAVGRSATPLRDRSVDRLVELLRPGREFAIDRAPAEGMEEVVVGGILTQLGRQALLDDGPALLESIPAVIEFALAPYLGRDAAAEVAAQPV